ncbi:ATP-dependent endonuclease [Streptomyces prunicolor]|uniref:ATP-dependent nuclease n=1 Tax=Streptomyces prunicolor TaxID=67348 RepID=UPI003711EEC0
MKIEYVEVKNWKSFSDTRAIPLGRINILVGRNNSGKSAFLRALHLLQVGSDRQLENVRLNEEVAQVNITLTSENMPLDINRHLSRANFPDHGHVNAVITLDKRNSRYSCELSAIATFSEPPFPETEPRNFIYTYFSKRKVSQFDRTVDRNRTVSIAPDLRNIVAKVSRLSSPDYIGFEEYTKLCQDVLGFRIGAYASEGGSQAGISIGRHDHVPIESMGEGVSSLLGLITDLCMGDGNLFLIEEPENDIHPESLKSLLKVIVEKSATNQFVVTTHSNIVTRYLGAARNSKVFAVDSEFTPGEVPTSRIQEIEPTPQARIEILRSLGYELSDFDLWDAWLILEESSAEMIIGNLIRWFIPRLARVRTVSANGVSKAIPAFEDFRRLFLFAHLENQYKGRAWVILDGDDAGKEIVQQMKSKYETWPEEHFRTWSHGDFEYYYPERFKDQALAVLALPHGKKRQEKYVLTRAVREWIDQNPNDAKAEFEESAAEVITFLREVDVQLFGPAE